MTIDSETVPKEVKGGISPVIWKLQKIVLLLLEREDPPVRFEYRMASEQQMVAEISIWRNSSTK